MISGFIWLKFPEDVGSVADAVQKSPSEIKELLVADHHNHKCRVFHIDSGEHREIAVKSCEIYPPEYLERLFMEDLYEKHEPEWLDPYGSIIDVEDHVVFHLWATIDDDRYHQKIVISIEELNDSYVGTYLQQYRRVLNRMVAEITREVNTRRYGPMPPLP